MNHIKNSRVPLYTLITLAVVYTGYLTLLGFSLHDFIWHLNIGFIFIAILGFYVVILIAILLFVTIFFNHKYKTIRGKTLALSLTLVFTVPLLGLVSYRVADQINYDEHYAFTTEKWLAADQNTRGRLIESFREQYDIVGLSLEEVTDLLGQPDETSEEYIYYYIGEYKAIIAIDPFIYMISLDNNLIVVAENIYSS